MRDAQRIHGAAANSSPSRRLKNHRLRVVLVRFFHRQVNNGLSLAGPRLLSPDEGLGFLVLLVG
jgi:hypothetical protein